MLQPLVRAGKLPAVADRLPQNPAIVPPLSEPGTYGGTWRLLGASVSDLQLNMRMGYEPLVRWDTTGREVVPGVAESWEMQDEGRTFIFHLRKGMKWSDGVPLTADDFVWTSQQVLRNADLPLISLTWLKSGNELPTVEAPDDMTVVFRFRTPYGAFPRALAFQGLQHEIFLPRHYVEKHHPASLSKSQLEEEVRKAGFRHWSDYFLWVIDADKNPDLPVVGPFKIKVPYPAARCIAERNPYYYKVDPTGKQLPYIDELAYTMVFDTTLLNLKAMNGEADFQLRRVDPANFTLFREQGLSKGYQVRVTPSTNCTCVYINQYSRDEALRPILQDRRFRQALAYAINREELVQLIFAGLAEPSGGFTSPQDTYYIKGLELANTKYDPELSNRLLDEIGLVRGRDGMRLTPDGKPFTQLLHVYPSEEGSNPNLWQLVSDYWREIGLNFVVKQEDATLSFLQVTAGNSDFWTYTNPGLHWDIEGLWKVPISQMSYIAPIHGTYYWSNGERGVAPPQPLQRLVDWYLEMRSTADIARRTSLGKQILQQWADECYVVGICRPPIVAIVSDRFHNVPQSVNYDYRLKSPGYLGIEQFFIRDQVPAK